MGSADSADDAVCDQLDRYIRHTIRTKFGALESRTRGTPAVYYCVIEKAVLHYLMTPALLS